MSNNVYSMFKTDREAEAKGIVLDYDQFRVTIARAGGANRDFKRVLEEASRPHQKLIQNDQFTNEQAEDLLKTVYAKTVVRDWEVRTKTDEGVGDWVQGISDPDTGDLLPFSWENVLKIFQAPELNDLYMDIRDSAQKAALFRMSLREEAAKNL